MSIIACVQTSPISFVARGKGYVHHCHPYSNRQQETVSVPKYTVPLNNEEGHYFWNSINDVFFNRKRFTL